jgi:hypothetical protein
MSEGKLVRLVSSDGVALHIWGIFHSGMTSPHLSPWNYGIGPMSCPLETKHYLRDWAHVLLVLESNA